MTHREFNNRNARRNLSSFIPARNQNIRPPKSAGGYIWKYYKQEKIEIMNNVKLKIKRVC